ncbi:MAG: peptide ABC transporter substrate-binding protein, partial [Lachnospiraceae bacterium]|nr:peptide ABC transporter substrate-binding protein [Lachnospiraceae bacterium]
MKKFLALLLAGVMAFSLAACGGSGSGGSSSGGTDETGAAPAADVAEPGTINVCIASEPDTIDPALNSAVDGATLLIHMFSGLAKWAQDENGALEIVPDCAEELVEGVKNEDGTVTYTYTLREGLTWSDGEPLTAGDFVFAWNRAAGPELAADYGYMFEIVDGYAEMWETDESGENFVNPDAVLNVEAPDDRTIVVTIENAVPYWNELLAFPTYFPVREDVVANEAWATDPATYVCNGAYTMASWDHNSLITLEKNESYYDAANVTMD